MSKLTKIFSVFIIGTVLVTLIGAAYLYAQREVLIQKAIDKISIELSNILGSKVEIGSINIGSLNTSSSSDITVNDVAVYDKNSELIAKVKSAEVGFYLLNLTSDPLAAIDTIKVHNVEGNIVKRSDESWNFEDLMSSESGGESKFSADILIDNANVNLSFDENALTAEIDTLDLNFDSTSDFNAKLNDSKISGFVDKNFVSASNINLNLDYDDGDIKADINTDAFDTSIQADIDSNSSRQIINVSTDLIDIAKVVPLIPADKIPEGVDILGGIAKSIDVSIEKRGDNYKYGGSAKVNDGAVIVEKTEIDDINGAVNFSNDKVVLVASAQANGQYAEVDGSIRLDTDEIYFDLNAQSDSFNPSAVMELPVEGVASFTAHLTGTVNNPIVDAKIKSPFIVYEDLSASNVSTNLKYFNNTVYLSELNANTFGGKVSGDFELLAETLAFNSHLKVDNIEVSRLNQFVPALSYLNGSISADLGINGEGDDIDKLKIYGSAFTNTIEYNGVEIKRVDTSFIVDGDDVKIDYLSAEFPDGGSLGTEGTIVDSNKLDLKFYAARIDLTVAEKFIPQVEVSGLADFKGEVHGDVSNPNIDLKFSAIDISQFQQAKKHMSEERINHFKGRLLAQPYDTIRFNANGSLDEIEISDFKVIRDGKDIWLAKGKVGLTGEKKIDLRVDTVGVRVEDLVNLLSPGQPLTGNVDNVITITGTIDKPAVTGYIHFWRGSYNGWLINGMDGDYFIDGDTIYLQDFHIFSPMVDMDLNGTINSKTTDMDFTVAVHDIDVHRFEGKLPEKYPAHGHGQFTGIIKGNLDQPLFDGILTAKSLNFNDVEINNVVGQMRLNGDDIYLDNFSFIQEVGSYKVNGKVNYKTNIMNGECTVKSANIKNLLKLSNVETEIVDGLLDSEIQVRGNLKNPALQIDGKISQGTLAECDIHDISLNVKLLNKILYLNKLEGFQGEEGTLNATGSADLNGDLNLKLDAKNLALEMFTKSAGINAEVIGTANFGAVVSGTVDNPTAQAELMASGGIKGSTFDLLKGNFELQNGIVDVEDLSVQKAIGEKIYQVSAKGKIPLVSLTSDKEAKLNSNEQINLDISLDNADLSLLPLLNEEYIAWGLGEMAGGLKITGTASQPIVNGQVELKNGTTKIKGMKSLIEHMNMLVSFKDDTMTVENCSGNIGSGTYNLNGNLKMRGIEVDDYKFKMIANKLAIESNFFNGPITAEFDLTKYKGRFRTLPKLAGHIDFDECTISIPTLPESEEESTNIMLDVAVNLGNDVHFYSPYLFDLYMIGSAKFEGTTNHPKPSGIITAQVGGTINYLKTVFNVREGELHFNQMDTFMPTITFNAETKIGRTRVYLTCDGDLKDRRMRLTSSPDMSETEIMQLLTLREAYQKGGSNEIATEDILLLGLEMSFLSEIEGAVKKTIGFDEFRISRGSGSAFDNKSEIKQRNDEEYNITIGKYINDNIMLRYTRGIGGDNINRYGILFDINSNISATIDKESHGTLFGIEARWKF